jgi:site-specific recombinase XerD
LLWFFSAKFKNPLLLSNQIREKGNYLRPSEIEVLIKAAKGLSKHGVRDAVIILLMFRHGLRTAELVAFKMTYKRDKYILKLSILDFKIDIGFK